MQSYIERRGRVEFPEFTGERIYMVPFRRELPAQYARWQNTVDQMLAGIEFPGDAYLMVDQGTVRAGTPHRRAGLHVDGNWIAASGRHGHMHAARWDNPGGPGWKNQWRYRPEAILLASDVLGARAYAGEFVTAIGPGGECDGAAIDIMQPVDLVPGYCWAGNVTMLHESLPLTVDAKRTVVRLSVPL